MVVKSKMVVFPKLTARLGIAASIALAGGCVSQPDPFGGDRPMPLPLTGSQRTDVEDSTRPKTQPGEIFKASSSTVTPTDPESFTPDEAVVFALKNNPTLHSVRLQRGLAEGGVVIAKTYPYNPVVETYGLPDFGPQSAGITNHFNFQASARLDLELRGQGKHRRAAADAVITRTEWEIATQEVQVSIATARAFNSLLYRNRKFEVLEDTVKLSQLVVDIVKKLTDAGRLRPADMILVRTELDTARALVGQGKVALAVARSDLRNQLGCRKDSFQVKGELDLPLPTMDNDTYAKVALELRPDLHARKAAVDEAQARLRLQVADRYGNISFGPSYEIDNTQVNYVGFALFAPIPVLNTHKGEIMQAQATVARCMADVRQIEVQSELEVQAALSRFAEARKWADSFATEVLPNLKKSTQDMEKLLAQNDPGVDVLKVIDVQRNYLRAFDAYLDALFEISQARADLAAAVGDPALALGLYAPQLPKPKPLPAPLLKDQP
jgi:cobalt-zinc-cadmium efflux system outer membrane protein